MGWDATYDEYYEGTGIKGRNVSLIISSVVQGLLVNPARVFTVVEQAYFQRWYETQSPALQAQVQGLVSSRQLVFANGGWSMHDEAGTSWVDMLDNTAVGHRNIVNNFGVAGLPTAASQLDDFGHSATQGLLSSPLAGYQGVIWAREPADFKFVGCSDKGIERVWQPSKSLGDDVLAFASVFVDNGCVFVVCIGGWGHRPA